MDSRKTILAKPIADWPCLHIATKGERGFISHPSSQYQKRGSILASTTTKSFSIFQVCNTNLKVRKNKKQKQKQNKTKKKKKQKTKLLSPYITNLCCAPTRTCFKFPCQFTTPRLYQARLVAIEKTTRAI